MNLLRRCTTLLSASASDLLERFENPELLLRQAIREMRHAVDQALRCAAAVLTEEKLLAQEVAACREQVEAWQTRAAAALATGDEPQAREALRRKAEYRRLVETLEAEHKIMAATATRLRRQIDGMRVRLVDAKRKLATLVARHRAATATKHALTTFATDNDPLAESASNNAFDRLTRKVMRAEAEAQVLAEFTVATEEEWRPTDSEIDRELSQMRAS